MAATTSPRTPNALIPKTGTMSMMFGSAALQTAAKFESLREAEAKLLAFAKTFGTRSADSYDIQVFDTEIPRSALPLKPVKSESSCYADCTQDTFESGDELMIHGVQVTSKTIFDESNTTETPLVLLHGYMNASAYFYRNLAGLSNYYQSIYSIDILGWGLSSRPNFDELKDDSLETAEDFFVESLELWRAKHNIDKMVLAGHSMGGYIGVAYCERYPQHVERLLLLSPVGVPDENDPSYQERKQRITSSFGGRAFLSVFQTLFGMTTVGSLCRTLPEYKGQQFVQSYVQKRLPEISDPDEQKALADYLFYNAVLPGSAEYSIHKFLNSNILANKPLLHRIPKLKVKNVSFMYGATDWMDISAALSTQRLCESAQRNNGGSPDVNVFMVRDAGHLLMLQNWHMTNAVLIHAGGGKVPDGQLPILMTPGEEDMSDSLLKESVRLQQERRGQTLSPPVAV